MHHFSEQGPVLLVCVYNRFGNIITHDYLYQLFNPYGDIVKILIFEKAKVWKTFIQFKNSQSAVQAMTNLNNKVIFQDGSKMNIFHSKLKHVQFQNDNLGGVNYQNLKSIQQMNEQNYMSQGNRKRRSTFQDYYSQQHSLSATQFFNFQYFDETTNPLKINSFLQPIKQAKEEVSVYCMQNSDSTFNQSETISGKKSYGGSYNNLNDIDDLFREIALESNQFREWEQLQEKNRKKSKTIFNPHSEQFLLQNCPSKVIFVRSIPQNYSHQCLYNIFINFGVISRIIMMKQKGSALVEYQDIADAIKAKDQINYVKSELKIFYSHYQSLVLRKQAQDQINYQYSNSNLSTTSKQTPFNPPSQTLYITMINPQVQQQLMEYCLELGCKVKNIEWKQNGKDKWMCLIQFSNINESLYVIGSLQNKVFSNGRKIKLSFTRSKIQVKQQKKKYFNYVDTKEME